MRVVCKSARCSLLKVADIERVSGYVRDATKKPRSGGLSEGRGEGGSGGV